MPFLRGNLIKISERKDLFQIIGKFPIFAEIQQYGL
jgi:hypothetical protein